MTIGERIRSVRKEKGLTQRALGRLLGVTQATVGQYETNQNPPKIETLQRIADALGVTPTFLIGYDEKIVKPEQYTPEDLAEIKAEAWGAYQQHVRETARTRINTAVDQMTSEGQNKVADYAEDILPRYRRQEAFSANWADQGTPAAEPPPESTEDGG